MTDEEREEMTKAIRIEIYQTFDAAFMRIPFNPKDPVCKALETLRTVALEKVLPYRDKSRG